MADAQILILYDDVHYPRQKHHFLICSTRANLNHRRTVMRKKRKRAKGKLIDLLPKSLKKPLDTPRLRELTVRDLHTIERQFNEYFDENPKSMLDGGCGICTKWLG